MSNHRIGWSGNQHNHDRAGFKVELVFFTSFSDYLDEDNLHENRVMKAAYDGVMSEDDLLSDLICSQMIIQLADCLP